MCIIGIKRSGISVNSLPVSVSWVKRSVNVYKYLKFSFASIFDV